MAHISGRTLTTFNILKLKNLYCHVVTTIQIPHLFKYAVLCRPHVQTHCRSLHLNRIRRAMVVFEKDLSKRENEKRNLPDILKFNTDTQIIYSSYIDDRSVYLDYSSRRRIEEKIKVKQKKKREEAPPLVIEKMLHTLETVNDELDSGKATSEDPIISFPYSHTEKVDFEDFSMESKKETGDSDFSSSNFTVKEDIACRMQAYEDGTLEMLENTNDNSSPDDYLINSVNEDGLEEYSIDLRPLRKDYGTADPSIPVSDVPCGGCGAHLHCQESAFPGNYL